MCAHPSRLNPATPSRVGALLLVGILIGVGLNSVAAAAAVQPRIVNGRTTFDYPAVGLLLLYDDSSLSAPAAFCSGTLIGCRTFLTAAHCVCPDNTDNAASCLQRGLTDPATMRVWLPHGGYFGVTSSTIHPDYTFARQGDVAIVHLAEPVTSIAPLPINTQDRPPNGTRGTLVGYGTTGGFRRPDDAGIKRQGPMTSGTCTQDLPNETLLCWDFQGTDASTCEGDSGGPLFMDLGAGQVIAGITSGGSSFDCTPPDLPFDTDVFVHREWILEQAGTDLGTTACGDTSPIDQSPSQIFELGGSLSAAVPDISRQVNVPAGSRELRVTLNSQLTSGQGPSSIDIDFDLFAAAGTTVSKTHFDCSDTDPSGFGACVIQSPTPGTWSVLAHREQGDGAFQLTTTVVGATAVSCQGDCNHDREVTIDELITGVGIALNTSPLSACSACDADGDGMVTVDELIAAVNRALNGCS